MRANADLLRAQAGGLPVRVASKSLRCVEVLRRVLAHQGAGPGFRGVLSFTPAEALHLAGHGMTDQLVAYPSVDREALCQVAQRVADGAPGRIVLMVDSVEGAGYVSRAARELRVRLPVAVDLDTAWRPVRGVSVGALRSPVRTPEQAAALTAALVADDNLRLVGLMAYEGQVAGVGDRVPGRPLRSLAVRGMQAASLRELRDRLPRVVDAVRAELARHGEQLDLVNGGGTGSLARTAAAGAVTELAAGSGLYAPDPLRHYRSLALRPAALFALPVVRRPAPGVATVLGGGYVASGPPGADRLPRAVLPAGLRLPARRARARCRPRSAALPPTGWRSATWCGSATPRPASCASGSTPCCWSRAVRSSTRCRRTAARAGPSCEPPLEVRVGLAPQFA